MFLNEKYWDRFSLCMCEIKMNIKLLRQFQASRFSL